MTDDERVQRAVEFFTEHALRQHHAKHRELSLASASECQCCGNPIPKARAHALPGVVLCIDCKRADERETARYQPT